jgi:hypothetical protein
VSDTGDYILGMVGLAAIAISMAIAGRTARRATLPGWTGAPALLADAVLAIGILVLVSELLGLFGVLDGVVLVGACVIVGGGGVRLEPLLVRDRREAIERGERGTLLRKAPAVSPIELGVAIALALLVAAQWAGPTLLALDRGIYGGDSLWYHMPFAAHIAQTGSVTELLFTDPLYLTWFYPQVSELLHADGLLVMGDDFLSPLMNLGWLGLALFAGWCCGRPYGVGAATSAAVAAVMAANLLFSRQPGNANNDVVAIALFLSSVAILLNARWLGVSAPRAAPAAPAAVGQPRGPGSTWLSSSAPAGRPWAGAEPSSLPDPAPPPVPDPAPRTVPDGSPTGMLITAGLAAGLAIGTKLTVVAPVLALTAGVILIAGGGQRGRAALGWGAGLLAGGGLWYLRNLIVSGNPFPWQDIGPIQHAEALEGRDPHAIVHYIGDTDVWGSFFRPALEERLGDLWPAYLILALAAVAVLLWRGGRIERMLATVAGLAAIAYLLTPLGASGPEGSPVGFRLNIRYLAPGLVLALVLAPIATTFLPGRQWLWRIGWLAVFAALIVVSAGAVEAIDTDRIPGTVILAVAVVALPVAAGLLAGRGVPRTVVAAGGVVAVVALAVVGRGEQEDYLELRYSSAAPDYPRDEHPSVELGQGLGAAYDWARTTRDASIALSGTLGALFQYGLWGEDATNQVRYIGDRGDRGSFEDVPECPEFIGVINTGDYDYVVTTPTYNQDDPAADTAPIQRTWVRAGRNVRRVAGAGLVDVWQLTGPVDPIACVRAPQSAANAPQPGTKPLQPATK